MIYIRTKAYNAEKTLQQAVDSVLNQTYRNFEYHILDNGSNDKTGAMLRAYAKKDKRIVPYYSKVNQAFDENRDFWDLSRRIPEGDFFCILDADDVYEPTFFEEMLGFMAEYRLEVVACGTVFVDGASGRAVGRRVLPGRLVLNSPEAWEIGFSAAHWNLRQVWGKLYSSRAAAAQYVAGALPDWWPNAYGSDTVNVMESVKAVKRFGVYGKILHRYTVSPKSVSYQWIPGREDADVLLHEKALEFLNRVCGRVSAENLRFLHSVYFYAFKDTVMVWAQASLFLGEKLAILRTILENGITGEMLSADMSGCGVDEAEKQNLLRLLLQIFEKVNCRPKDESALTAVYTALNPDFGQFIPPDRLLWYLAQAPELVTALAMKDYEGAAQFWENTSLKASEENVEMARTLAAVLGNRESYVYYSKLLIELLIQAGELSSADEELTEWEKILPGDEELAVLRLELEKIR